MDKKDLDTLIAQIASEKKRVSDEIHSAEGLLRLQEVAQAYEGEYRLVSSDEIKKEIADRPVKKMHMTGNALIDDLLGGLREQMVVGLAAHSGHGKTAMGLFLTEKYKDLNPVFIALEQSAEELIEQRTANGQFVPHFYTNKTYASRVRPDWLEQRVIEGVAKFNSRLIVIDHLGYVDPDARHDKDQEHLRIERKMQSIKTIAKRWNVIILVLVHISQLDESTPPNLLNLKGSSAIKQECDKVILLWRKNKMYRKIRIYDNETLFSLQKNRWSGKNGAVGLLYQPETGHYVAWNGWVEAMERMAKESDNENF
jgi:replicative DNA helicase